MVNQGKFNKIYIKKRSLPEWLALYLFLYPFIIAFLLDMLRLPSFIKYTADLAWVGAMVIIFFEKRILFSKKVTPFVLIVSSWLIICGVVYVLNYQSIFYFLWGFRNTFRYFAAFFAYTMFFDEDNAKSCIKLMDVAFWINLALTCIQFFILGYKGDFLGGIFGVELGCNGYSIVLLLIVLSKSLILCMEGKERLLYCCIKCGAALAIAAIAGIKAFFLFFAVILIFTMMLTKFSWKKAILVVVAFALISVTITLLPQVFGAEEELTIEYIRKWLTSTNYASTEDLGRFSAIPTISDRFLTNWPERLFGMGLGNCDTAAFKLCRTPFYETYSYLHYNWFLSAFLFIETGAVGLFLYFLFFAVVLVMSYKKFKRAEGNRLFCQLAIILSAFCFILAFYNITLRREFGYVIYFILALPFISSSDECKTEVIGE